MFRKMRRFKQQLSNNKCREILNTQWRGVVSVLGDNGYPHGAPMNFYYSESDNALYFQCAKEGHKIDAIKACDKVSFTVIDDGKQRENHWSKDFNSVVIFGRISVIEDILLARDKMIAFANKFFPDKSEIDIEMNQHFKNKLCLKLDIEHMTGKQINES